jgi:hypothetical protein
MITIEDINLLMQAATLANIDVALHQVQLLEPWIGGINHGPVPQLPLHKQAVYFFKYEEIYLKVGKAGPNANARYQSQHYSIAGGNSTLAGKLIADPEMQPIIQNNNIGNWIKNNTTRYNILINADCGLHFLNFAEAFFILRCNPKYEGAFQP